VGNVKNTQKYIIKSDQQIAISALPRRRSERIT